MDGSRKSQLKPLHSRKTSHIQVPERESGKCSGADSATQDVVKSLVNATGGKILSILITTLAVIANQSKMLSSSRVLGVLNAHSTPVEMAVLMIIAFGTPMTQVTPTVPAR